MSRPSDALWHLSRAAGITAYLALTLAVAFGLFLSTGLADRWISRARSVEVHRWLSSVMLGLVGAHAAALLGDRFLRFDVVDVLLPFASRYRPFAVGLGVLAGYTALAVHASFALRARLGTRAWRALHYASFGLYVLATAHGILAGSDAGLPWMGGVYLGSLGVVTVLTGCRVAAARGAHLPQSPRGTQGTSRDVAR